MPSDYLSSPLIFILQTLFSLYILCIMLRFLLQWLRADFYNPVSQFLVTVTNPLLKPLRRVIPGYAGLDSSAIVLMIGLQMLALFVTGMIRGYTFGFPVLMLGALAELIELLFNVFIFSILIQAILSWVNPGAHNPISTILYSLNEPLLKRARRLLPPVSGLDLSPLVVIVILQVVKMLAMPPLQMLVRAVQ